CFLEIPSIDPANFFKALKAENTLRNFITQRQINIIHSYSPRNNMIGSVVDKRTKVSVIWHERNIPVEGEKDISRIMMGLPDVIICNSQAVAKRFEKDGQIPAKIRVIYNGINLTR